MATSRCVKTAITLALLIATITVTLQAVEPVWPGSNTRFYPGIYPRIDMAHSKSVTLVTDALAHWWGTVNRDLYREYLNGQRVSHIGVKIQFTFETLFSSYWFRHVSGPYNYATNCANSELMQNPDAVAEGQPIYDWSLFDAVLNLPEVAAGEYKIMFKLDDQDVKSAVPKWFFTQKMMDSTQQNPKKYDWVYIRMKMDVLKAWATRYAGDPRIAGIELEEYAGVKDEGPVCGYSVPGQTWQVSAENGRAFFPAQAMLEADPGMMIIFIAPAGMVTNYFDGVGAGLGLNDLPGIQGIAVQDIKFFEDTCGAGAPGEIDCMKGDWGMRWLAQQALVRNDLPVMVHAERNGWGVRNTNAVPTRRGGDQNPWGVAKWPKDSGPWNGENVGGVATNTSGDPSFADPMFWVWYNSGPPRAQGDAADSKLGQIGPDPAGVLPAVFYDPSLPWCSEHGCAAANKFPKSWNLTNNSIARFLKAFEVFGPSGTKAMFNYPKGYLDQFASGSE